MAPLAAAALPPPGIAVGAASCSMNGSIPARKPPTAILPLITAASRFSRISEESKFSTCRNHSAACSKARFGIRPTISLETGNDAVARGLALHKLKDAMHRRLLKIGQVHRNLRQAAHQKSRCLDEAQPAGGKAHGLGDASWRSSTSGVFRKML